MPISLQDLACIYLERMRNFIFHFSVARFPPHAPLTPTPLTSPPHFPWGKKKERKNNRASRGTRNVVKGQSWSLWQWYKSALLSRLLGNSPWKQDQPHHKGLTAGFVGTPSLLSVNLGTQGIFLPALPAKASLLRKFSCTWTWKCEL